MSNIVKIIKEGLFDSEDVGIMEGEGYKTLSFFLQYPTDKKNPKGNPIPKQSVRHNLIPRKNAKPIVKDGKKYYLISDLYINSYQTAIITKTEEFLKQQLVYLLNRYKFLPFTKKVSIEAMIFYFSPLTSMKKSEKETIELGNVIMKITKPDLPDNLKKLLLDAMESIVFNNDSLICKETNTAKVYGKKPGVFIKIKGEL